MQVPVWVWLATIAVVLCLFAMDFLLVDRRPHAVSVGEAARWVVFYITMAVLFGIGIGYFSGGHEAKQYFAGYVTEYSLSIDNLFVFIVIISAFKVPSAHQHKVLLVGVLGSLILRGALIAAGSAIVSRFEWVFYIFGAFLIATAARLAVPKKTGHEDYREPAGVRVIRRFVPLTDRYHGGSAVVRIKGKRYATPLLLVMAALTFTDLIFAFDSIPAIFGLTDEPYIIFVANAFALMGLRQLYFMVGGLLNRLVYLSHGLAVVLAFIGVKLIFEALADSGVSWAPHIGIELSLGVIVSILVITTVASLLRSRVAESAPKEPIER
jgi:TerC family integral membrane protein